MQAQDFIKKFKVLILIWVAALVVVGFLVSKVIPIVGNIIKIQKDTVTNSANLKDKQRTLETIKTKLEETKRHNNDFVKAFYKPIEQGVDTETAIAEEFGEILVLMRSNSIKTRSINYTYDPQDDNFVKNMGDKYSVAKLDIEMIGTYKNFERFLKELYRHEHFLDIVGMEVVPYQRDKKILIIKFQLKLYAQKN